MGEILFLFAKVFAAVFAGVLGLLLAVLTFLFIIGLIDVLVSGPSGPPRRRLR